MEKLILKSLLLMGLIATLQSCSKKNDLPINAEKAKAQQTESEKQTSTIRVIPIEKQFFNPYILNEGAVTIDFDGNGITDLTFHGVGSFGSCYVKSNLGVLRYKANRNLSIGPFRLTYGQAGPVGGAAYSGPNNLVGFIDLPNEMTYYIGFKVKYATDQKVHFGWAKVKQQNRYGGYVYEVAINDAPNTPVFAGEI